MVGLKSPNNLNNRNGVGLLGTAWEGDQLSPSQMR
jgi:hypothetical protein